MRRVRVPLVGGAYDGLEIVGPRTSLPDAIILEVQVPIQASEEEKVAAQRAMETDEPVVILGCRDEEYVLDYETKRYECM